MKLIPTPFTPHSLSSGLDHTHLCHCLLRNRASELEANRQSLFSIFRVKYSTAFKERSSKVVCKLVINNEAYKSAVGVTFRNCMQSRTILRLTRSILHTKI